jgi:hypothetical protein
VLDVGSGNGAHILELNSIGINAIGIDPFIAKDFIKNHALIVRKGSLTDLNDKNFIELIRVDQGTLQKFVNKTELNIFKEELLVLLL